MATKKYDREGNLQSYSISDAERSRGNAANAALFLILLMVAVPIAPFIGLGLAAGVYASTVLAFHDLASIVVAITPIVIGVWLLFKFSVFRRFYFLVYTIFAGIALTAILARENDLVWSIFFGVAISGVLHFYFRFLHRSIG